MSMGDMLMVKGEEGDTITDHKAQVILHLQSISQGANDDIADTPTTVLAVETHQEDSSTEGDEVEYGYPITCGDSRAVLLYKKFVCPGINVKCVKFNDQLISPKQFVQLAGKSTLKDWKRAIRLGGVMLRKMMDSGQIDFYQHDTVCTNSCRSTKFDLLINNTRLPSAAHLPTPTSPLPGGGQILHMEEKSEDSGSVMMEARTSHMIPVQSEANGEIKKEIEDPDESLSFWQGLSELGLVGEVVSSIRTELLALLRGVEQRGEQALLHHTDAAVLSTLTQMFGLLDSVRQVLDMQRSRTADSEELLHNRLDVLECQLDNQKRQPLDWRTHPSSPFPIIVHTPLEATPFGRPPFGKRPRLQRSASTSSASASSAAASSGSPFTVLSPVTFSPLGQTHSVPGLPISSLAQLPTGSQLFPLHSASAVTGAYRGGKAEVLGISPASGLSLPGAASLRHPGALSAMEVRPPSREEMQERAVDVVERRREPEREREEEEEEERGRRRAMEDEEEEEEEAMAVDGAEAMVGERRQEEKQRREEGGQRTHKTSGAASKKKTHKRAFH